MSGLLTVLLLGAFQVALFWLFQFEVPDSNRDLVVFMLGQLSGFTGAGVAYYLGNTEASTQHIENMGGVPPPPRDPPPPLPVGRDLPRPTFGTATPDDPDQENVK